METLLTLPQTALLGIIGILDALPDGARAALAAGLLIVFLRLFERKIPAREIQYGQSFRKSALVALIIIPLFVYLVPASRMTVFVEDLQPAAAAGHPVWLVLMSVWLTGVTVSFVLLMRSELAAAREASALPDIADEKLAARLMHWCRRLGMAPSFTLVESPGALPRFHTPGNRVALPAAARHWPGNLQDVLLITTLVHRKRRHRGWHLLGRFTCCLYWPVTWVQVLTEHLLADFQRAADQLAESCYRDHLGYDRALRQLAQRLAPPPGQTARNGPASPDGLPARCREFCREYHRRLGTLIRPDTEPVWQLAALLEARSDEVKPAWTDPYDKVVLFVGQAMFFAFLLTGATLKEKPPEVDYEYSLPFELFWKEHFHRNLELQEKVRPMPGD